MEPKKPKSDICPRCEGSNMKEARQLTVEPGSLKVVVPTGNPIISSHPVKVITCANCGTVVRLLVGDR